MVLGRRAWEGGGRKKRHVPPLRKEEKDGTNGREGGMSCQTENEKESR